MLRLVHNPIVNPLCGFPSFGPAGMECVDFGELRCEKEACGACADDEDVYFGFGHAREGLLMKVEVEEEKERKLALYGPLVGSYIARNG